MSNVVISASSWHTRLYQWYYNQYWELPKTLCGYFWLTLLAVITTPILFPFVMIYIVAEMCIRRKNYWGGDVSAPSAAVIGLVATVIVSGIVGCFIAWIDILFLHISFEKLEGFTGCCFVMGNMVLALFLVKKLIDWLRYKERNKSPRKDFYTWARKNNKLAWKFENNAETDSYKEWLAWKDNTFFKLMGKALKAWYERNCPIIEWKDNE